MPGHIEFATPRGAESTRPRLYFAKDASNSKARRGLRKGMLAVLAAVRLMRSTALKAWARHATAVIGQGGSEGSVLSMEGGMDLPDTFYDALEGVVLTPGWVMESLPAELQRQVQLYAKHKIVRLLTPAAKLAAHRIRRSLAKRQLLENGDGLPGAKQLMAASTEVIALWPESAASELLGLGRVRAYLAGSWVSIPPRPRHQMAATMTFSGTASAAEVLPYDDGKRPRAFGCYYILSGEVAEEEAGGDGKAKILQPGTLRGDSWGIAGRSDPPGLRAHTTCLILEFDYRDILRIANALPEPHFSAVRDRVATARVREMKLAGMSATVLQSLPFFANWERLMINQCLQKLTPRVFFANEVVASEETSSDTGTPPMMCIVTRGTVRKEQHRDGPGNNGALGATLTSELSPLTSFGEYSLTCDERHDAVYRAVTATVDVWTLSRSHLQQIMKAGPAFKKAVLGTAVELREQAMMAAVVRDRLRQVVERELVSKHGWLSAAAALGAPIIAQRMHARVLPAGERITSAGDDATNLIMYAWGKLNESTAAGFVSHSPPVLFGNLLSSQEKWKKSLVAMRNVECWVASKASVSSAIRKLPEEQQAIVAAGIPPKGCRGVRVTMVPQPPPPKADLEATMRGDAAPFDPATIPQLDVDRAGDAMRAGGSRMASSRRRSTTAGLDATDLATAHATTETPSAMSRSGRGGSALPVSAGGRVPIEFNVPALHSERRCESARKARAEKTRAEMAERHAAQRLEKERRERACEVEIDRDTHPSVLDLERVRARLRPPPKDVLVGMRRLQATPRVSDRPSLVPPKKIPPPDVAINPDGLGLQFNRDITVELQECKVRVKTMIAAEMKRAAERRSAAAAAARATGHTGPTPRNASVSPSKSQFATVPSQTPVSSAIDGQSESRASSAADFGPVSSFAAAPTTPGSTLGGQRGSVSMDAKSMVAALTLEGLQRRRSTVRSEQSEGSSGAAAPRTARPPTGPKQYGGAEKRVLRQIMATHRATKKESRQDCVELLSPGRMINDNPFSSLLGRKTPIPRASGVGNLYYEQPPQRRGGGGGGGDAPSSSPGRKKRLSFNPAQTDVYVTPSAFSIHSKSGALEQLPKEAGDEPQFPFSPGKR